MHHRFGQVGAGCGALAFALAGCISEVGDASSRGGSDAAALDDVAAIAATTPMATASIALADFEGYADPATGSFVIERVAALDPFPQIQALYEGGGVRTAGQAIAVWEASPAPWCTARVVNDGAIGTNPASTFELWTDPASIASVGSGGPIPTPCAVGGPSAMGLYLVDGVFCATVRAKNFYPVPWNAVVVQLRQFYGAVEQSPYGLGLGTSVATRDGATGELLPAYSNLPSPGDDFALWGYGNLAASGGASTATWTFRNASTGSFRFSGRVLGNLAENCATPAVNEDCDPLARGDNGCRAYETGEVCTNHADCVSNVCDDGFCADGCAPGLYGVTCQNVCPGGLANVCSGHGSCGGTRDVSDSCTCDPGYFGSDCSVVCDVGETYVEGTGCVIAPGECAPGTLDFYMDGSACLAVTQVSAGGVHACAVLTDGTLWCWGDNRYGQLGDGTLVTRRSPAQVGVATDWTAVDAGDQHTCGIRGGGALYCWGNNIGGKLGDGTTTTRVAPVRIWDGTDDWAILSVGDGHTCGVRTGIGLFCWGSNFNGQLGDGTTTQRTVPTQVGSESDWAEVSAGGAHTCGIRPTHGLFCWGANGSGRLGDGTTTSRLEPVQVGGAADWSGVSAARTHTCGVRSGEAYCWGANSDGWLGDGTNDSRANPTRVGTASDWLAVEGADTHSCGIRDGVGVFCWGRNESGQIGDGSYTERRSPRQAGAATDWTAVVAGDEFSCGVRASGALYCWGNGDDGQIADGSATAHNEPVAVGSATDWTAVTAGENHTCGIRGAGQLYCWGDPVFGALGDDSWSDGAAPIRVGLGSSWTTASVGSQHTCATVAGVGLYCWGNGFNGQLGDGTTDGSYTPIQVGVDADWTAVSAGLGHSCGLRSDGRIFCWGFNGSGELGDGTATVVQLSPVQIGAAMEWVDVQAGSSHTCGVEVDGKAFCWGWNSQGQLGDGSTSARNSPTEVGTASAWTSISPGGSQTCGISDQKLFCWGRNIAGEVGDGTNVQRRTPVEISTGTQWVEVDAGGQHSCGIRADGQLYCWGNNSSGQLGVGTNTSSNVPVRIGDETDWSAVSAGLHYTCAIRDGGRLFCWGYNGEWQLGNGAIVPTASLVRVAP